MISINYFDEIGGKELWILGNGKRIIFDLTNQKYHFASVEKDIVEEDFKDLDFKINNCLREIAKDYKSIEFKNNMKDFNESFNKEVRKFYNK